MRAIFNKAMVPNMWCRRTGVKHLQGSFTASAEGAKYCRRRVAAAARATVDPFLENRPRASPRSRQQRRSGSASLEEENAARGGVPRDEIAAELREAFGTASARTGRGGPPLSQAVAQADGARGLLSLSAERRRFPPVTTKACILNHLSRYLQQICSKSSPFGCGA